MAPGELLRAWFQRHARVFVLTGAGISTGSGIPDYRDASGAWKRPAPVTWQAFTADTAVYRRYWARSYVGWPRFSAARPNDAHHAFAALENAGRISMLLTQNVDGLHQAAGSRNIVDLHGRLDAVVCLGCGDRHARTALQSRLADDNPQWQARTAGAAPDGDADIDPAAEHAFAPPYCMHCGGLLKPDVVFFGENVPRARVAAATAALADSDAMLVVGSSLMVYSGFRFARMAAEAGTPLAILNRGTTRADDLATLKVDSGIDAGLAWIHAERTASLSPGRTARDSEA
ncbi:NAD-dependent protein deacetylase [Luteimonas deserti]|uniref:NAD-dependent protein deacetylase n=1 Tax=Luteimonas deserti TaxID=2752306 RepID=A0A7Z0QUD0_9GAMM|nr:NAD-dependent protein deacetylase [Luteimonas deserti]NYZ64111.1 NAD-dependent protein deacetylase [Luteimonas deserti]